MQELLNDFIIPHWPFMVVTLILAMAGQIAKGTLWTKENIKKYHGSTMGHIVWWGRKTLPLHPVLLGAVVGLLPGVPVPEDIATTTAKIMYFCGAGVASTWAFAILKQLAKEKGIELDIPGESVTPPPPPPPAGQA